MKRFFVSVAIGVFIPALVFAGILVVKILYPGRTPVSLIMFFIWPVRGLVVLFPKMPLDQALLLSFLLGMLINILVLSLIAYFAIRTVQRRTRNRPAPIAPPQPPTF